MTPAPNTAIEFPALVGVKAGRLYGVLRRSVTSIIDALQWHRCVGSSGARGRITVYRDDNGNYRCLFVVRQATRSAEIFATKLQVHAWLRTWHPQQGAQQQGAQQERRAA